MGRLIGCKGPGPTSTTGKIWELQQPTRATLGLAHNIRGAGTLTPTCIGRLWKPTPLHGAPTSSTPLTPAMPE